MRWNAQSRSRADEIDDKSPRRPDKEFASGFGCTARHVARHQPASPRLTALRVHVSRSSAAASEQ